MIINGFPVSGGTSGIDISTATVTLVSSSLTYDGRPKTKQVQSVVLGGNTLVAGTDYVVSGNVQVNTGTYLLTVAGVGDYSGSASASWSIAKATATISIDKNNIELTGMNPSDTITVTTNSDGNISATSSDTDVCTVFVSGNNVTATRESPGNSIISIQVLSSDNFITSEITTCNVESIANIYGVSWNKQSTSALTRTDDSANFTDPVPCLSGGIGSSPFDELMPWSGMVKETFADGNVMVKIPKFWYKWTDGTNSLKLQIADAPVDGFYVSPAHADRGDGKGERDYVYIGRYHCNSSYKSISGVTPKINIKRATARSGCTALGAGYYQLDYAMWWTIRMLYLVEFADWDSQKVIGYGCGDDSAVGNMGYTDSMTYHTGTTKANRTTYGLGTQYRWIEGLWDNAFDWVDGIVIYNRAAYVCTNPANFGEDITNHTKVTDGLSSDINGYIQSWEVPSVNGFNWALFPKTVNTSSVYVMDIAIISSRDVVVYVGGCFWQHWYYGMFFFSGYQLSGSYGSIGARLQYLP